MPLATPTAKASKNEAKEAAPSQDQDVSMHGETTTSIIVIITARPPAGVEPTAAGSPVCTTTN